MSTAPPVTTAPVGVSHPVGNSAAQAATAGILAGLVTHDDTMIALIDLGNLLPGEDGAAAKSKSSRATAQH